MIFASKPTTCVYLYNDRLAAMADYLCSRYGLEVPVSFEVPTVQFLPDDNANLPVHHHTRHYKDGGCAWPARWIVRTP